MVNKYEETTQPYRTSFLRQNYCDSVSATLKRAVSCTVWPAGQSSAKDIPCLS